MKLLRALSYCLFYNRVYRNIVRLLMILGEHFAAAKSSFTSSQQFCSATKTGKQPLTSYLGVAVLSFYLSLRGKRVCGSYGGCIEINLVLISLRFAKIFDHRLSFVSSVSLSLSHTHTLSSTHTHSLSSFAKILRRVSLKFEKQQETKAKKIYAKPQMDRFYSSGVCWVSLCCCLCHFFRLLICTRYL